VGVLDAALDVTAADAAEGMRWVVVTSGKRKADGNPHVAVTEAAESAMRSYVDATAQLLFGWVAEARGAAPDAIDALEAATFLGAQAPEWMLDGAESWDACLAAAAVLTTGEDATLLSATPDNEDSDMATLREQLAAAAESDDEKEARRAKAALAAYDKAQADDSKEDAKAADEDNGDDDKDGDDSDAKAQAKAEDDDKDDDGDAKASAAAPVAQALAAQLGQERARAEAAEARAATVERDALFASRPDVPEEVKAALADAPIAQARAVLDAMKPAASAPPSPVNQLARPPASGRNPGPGAAERPTNSLSAEMGLAPVRTGVHYDTESNTLQLGAVQHVTPTK
jgi:ClpP class serine protease